MFFKFNLDFLSHKSYSLRVIGFTFSVFHGGIIEL